MGSGSSVLIAGNSDGVHALTSQAVADRLVDISQDYKDYREQVLAHSVDGAVIANVREHVSYWFQ